jgi:hypothetical protein
VRRYPRSDMWLKSWCVLKFVGQLWK